MNLHTHFVQTMAKENLEQKNAQIVSMLEGIINTIDELFENPVFINNIEGEEELRLDSFTEMLESMVEQFIPAPKAVPFQPQFEAESFDAN